MMNRLLPLAYAASVVALAACAARVPQATYRLESCPGGQTLTVRSQLSYELAVHLNSPGPGLPALIGYVAPNATREFEIQAAAAGYLTYSHANTAPVLPVSRYEERLLDVSKACR